MERETASSLKKRTYGSLSLGGSYGTAKRGDLSLLRLGSSFGRLARSDIRLDDYGILPHGYDPLINSYSGNKYSPPRNSGSFFRRRLSNREKWTKQEFRRLLHEAISL
ncbi:hypothetical protein WA026_000526 [Henosepilachna vigintioctopunctata]|uniref:Uncharacterized protein n=1 Tax=Henosepilachna vigintioctopunctata TaxID=420089 RepID=A0AAW1UZK0_9CUCU